MAARMLVVLSWLLLASPATAQMPAPETKVDSAPVEVDGDPLFRVRGMEALPAEQRAARISTNITTLAADRSFHAESLRTVEHIDGIAISAGGALVMLLTNEDAALEGIDRALLAPAYVDRIRRAITDYRHVRTREGLVASAGRSVAAIAIAATLIAVLLWLLRRSEGTLRRGFDRRMAALTTGSRAASRTEGLWQMVP